MKVSDGHSGSTSSWAERQFCYLLLVCQGWTQPAPPSTVALKQQQPGPKLWDNGCVAAPGDHGALRQGHRAWAQLGPGTVPSSCRCQTGPRSGMLSHWDGQERLAESPAQGMVARTWHVSDLRSVSAVKSWPPSAQGGQEQHPLPGPR